ncbi:MULTISPECIES: methanogenesis marker 9 domain-containing protein [unclassified Methanoculleus]|uniref:methanogenesis marker 9 domain-containing protein n=1 Tax=unclassified Methanoculleus TaxID=2619537 RepID=UPI0025F79EA3|nr:MULTISPECIES: methanogenesis marker 9 domain-containing protein [unclassified Methanoculleus]MCK9317277.1 methanogenesis marker 9 domain-containing protein [Methanoculleus sp.]MDD2253143.1 methanogenesis marker 9 domain-containing protein [Methanoculleus sp.]MDD2788412.1 methanogenesis marker 9 domain-containing protein [Methanoculleus sp.]MDD3215837.1 methanogenesis marker 9 domain-containing protein [Methanoculleus sp.]MDD4313728.1 methanogenesis marker 9 domain-containing protein [Methan
MMEAYDRFELLINDRVVKTPVAIASMAGIVDAAYVLERAAHVGTAFIGGYSIDDLTLDASRRMAAGGRKEFVYDDPLKALEKEIDALKESDVVTGINLRGSTPAAYAEVAAAFEDRVVYEIDAHCRQPPMIEAGCGEYLLHHPVDLVAIVRALKAEGVTVSVKVRAGIAGNDAGLARAVWKAGADILHVDLMDFGHNKVRQIRNASPMMLIANNSINTFDKAMDAFSHGADLVSLARKSDPWTLAGLDAAISRAAEEGGWYNAPKQICRGGDIRGLAFCCMPVKACPLIPTLDKLGISRNEYLTLKQEAVKGTPLEDGRSTCFGSLAWCCKISSPCMFRNMTLESRGLSAREYMRCKHRLSEKIMNRIFDESKTVDESC